jgi:hypothetical protein
MVIQSLRLLLTDDDFNHLIDRFLPRDVPVVDLRISVLEGAIEVSGKYPLRMLSLPFRTTWEPSIREGRVHVCLGSINVVGLPAGFLRGLFVNGFRKLASKLPGFRVEDEELIIDVDRLLQHRGVPLQTNFKALQCHPGQMLLES